MQRRIAWPKLLGSVLALESGGLILLRHGGWWDRVQFGGPLMAFDRFAFALVVVLCVLSYGVFRAREWARRCVIVVGLLGLAVLLIGITLDAFHYIGRPLEFSHDAAPPELIAAQIDAEVSALGLTVCLAAPLALLVCLSAHPDVARSFHARTTKAI